MPRGMLAPHPDPAGPSDMDTVAPSGCKTWVDICFEHLCLQGLVDYVFLIRWCRVSREWMDALKRAVRLMQQVSLPGGVTGEEALRALGLVAGGNINIIDLRGCSLISAEHMASIVALVREECPGAMEINIEGCSDWAVVRAVAECVAETFGISTSRELYQRIKEMGNGERCAFPRLLEQLQEGPGPRLALDPEFKPEAEPQSDEDSDGEDDFSSHSRILARFTDGGETGPVCAKVMAVLLGVSFDDDKFQCSKSQLRDAAARGDTELVSLLLDAGVDINEANEQGDTALLAAVATGNLVELAELLVSWGADVKAQRRDGAGLIALAIHSKCPDSISFALRYGPERIASQSTLDALAQAYASPRNIQQWLLAGASPRTLALEIGALLLHPKVDAGRLDDMRALLHRHKKLLQDTAKWPVPHVVEQLAAQDLGASVQQDATDGSGEGMCRLIECITPSSATGEYGRLVNAQACRWSIEGDNAVDSVAFSPDMLKLARGEGNDALVCCAVSGLEFRRLVGHRDYVSSVGFNPTNPSQLVSASWDKTIRLWDVDSGKELKKLEGHSPDNEECTCKHDAGEDEDGYEADLNCPVQGHSDVVWSVAWGFDGKLLASGGAEHKIILWDPKKGARLKTLEGHSDAVFGVAWSIDGLIASASRDRTLKLWNPSAGECLKTLEGHSGVVYCVSFNPSHPTLLVSGSDDRTVRLWDVGTGKELKKLEGHSSRVNGVSFSADGSLVASCSGHSRWLPPGAVCFGGGGSGDCSVRMWSVETGQELKKFLGHSDEVNCVSFNPSNPTLLVSGSGDSTVRLWDVGTGKELKKLEGHRYSVKKVEFSQDGATLVSSDDSETFSRDVATGARKDKVAGQSPPVMATDTIIAMDSASVVATGPAAALDRAQKTLRQARAACRLTSLPAWAELAFTKATNGRYIVKRKDDLIFVYDTRGGVVNADGEEKVPIAFFRAPSPVVSICCAGDKVAVGCQSGAVLTLHAAWLTDGGAVVEEVEDEQEQEEEEEEEENDEEDSEEGEEEEEEENDEEDSEEGEEEEEEENDEEDSEEGEEEEELTGGGAA